MRKNGLLTVENPPEFSPSCCIGFHSALFRDSSRSADQRRPFQNSKFTAACACIHYDMICLSPTCKVSTGLKGLPTLKEDIRCNPY
ncbi:hypothetical protein BaRGS_00002847 [Batillaria attramentaria]|uniref:Uncharacterized protein n=1 Tax=Batillaria attramentaria TaxID=370345 RepID=A0ABD0M2Y3_9CAEN